MCKPRIYRVNGTWRAFIPLGFNVPANTLMSRVLAEYVASLNGQVGLYSGLKYLDIEGAPVFDGNKKMR